MTVQLRYVLSEPIDLVNGTSIIEHGPMCIELCRFRCRKFNCILMCGGMPAEHAERAYEHACPPRPSKKIDPVEGVRAGAG
jgi:hypothetical protein